jgi:hypothetical protein
VNARIENAKQLEAARIAAAEDARINERTRQLGIRKVAADAGLGGTWADDLIEADCSVDEARNEPRSSVRDREGVTTIEPDVRAPHPGGRRRS